MRYLFVVILAVLSLASMLTWWTAPDQQSEVPTLYWITDPHPGRKNQIDTFHRWLEKNKHPPMEMVLDAANNDVSKKLIQGISGVAGEILDASRGKQEMLYLYQSGILKELTEPAKELGFGKEHTWDAIVPDLMIDGEQYGFPRNVAVMMYWVNKDTFTRYGIELPSERWTWDDFERIGREYVKAANADNPSPRRFFAMPEMIDPLVLPTIMMRSKGMDLFNETLTECTLNDPRYVSTLKKINQWIHEDRLIPSSADQASFSGSAGFGGAILHLFKEGDFGILMMGRYALLQLRMFEPMNLAVVEPPYEYYPNTLIFAGVPTIYREAKHVDLAKYFLAYMASEDYNMLIVRDGDALPPNPIYTRTEEFLRPAAYPNEWGCHGAFADAADSIAITYSSSRFVLPVTVTRLFLRYYDLFTNSRATAEESAESAAKAINAAIQINLKDRPLLQKRYEEKLSIQAKIDALKAEGAPIPAEWIDNPFYLKYYNDRGLLK